jgi:hypothetical protein
LSAFVDALRRPVRQSPCDGLVPFPQSPTQEAVIQSDCEEISLLLDKNIYDQTHSSGTVVRQMNPVNGCRLFR